MQITLAVRAALAPNNPALSGTLFVSDQNTVSLTTGSAVGSGDGAYSVSGNVSAGTPVVLNLASATDPVGNPLTVGHIVALLITNTSAAGGGNLSHGGGTNPIYSAAPLPVTPGDSYAQTFNGSGLVVTSGSAQNLQLTASAGTVSYKVTAIVRSG
jgi:hypothetical protein